MIPSPLELTTEQRGEFSRGFDAGNYDAAYVSEDFFKAAAARLSQHDTGAFMAGYLCGFFGSYESHEIPEVIREWTIVSRRTYAELIK